MWNCASAAYFSEVRAVNFRIASRCFNTRPIIGFRYNTQRRGGNIHGGMQKRGGAKRERVRKREKSSIKREIENRAKEKAAPIYIYRLSN